MILGKKNKRERKRNCSINVLSGLFHFKDWHNERDIESCCPHSTPRCKYAPRNISSHRILLNEDEKVGLGPKHRN